MNIDAPTPMMNSEAEVISVSIMAVRNMVKFSRPAASAITMEPTAPTAPASVAVKKPENSPPKTMTISTSTGQMFMSACRAVDRSASSGRGGQTSGRNHESAARPRHRRAAVRSPMLTPPTKTLVTEVSAKTP